MSIFSINKSVSFLLQLMDTKKSTQPVISLEHNKPQCKKTPIENAFKRGTPESVGISSKELSEFLLKLKNDKNLFMHGITVIKDRTVVFESGFSVYETDIPQYTFSACKSVTSMAIGILIGDGKLKLTDKLYDIFPELFTPITKLKLRDLTIEDILTMRSTVTFSEMNSMLDDDWLKGYINSSTKGTIGQTFNYNSLNTYVLSAVVCKIAGESMTSFLDKRLFKPLKITNYFWETCPKNIEKGGWGLYICPEDFAKLAQLFLDDGVYDGRQLIPAAYVKNAIKPHAKTPNDYGFFDYGFQIWSGRNSNTFLFNGMFGQNVLTFKDSNIIIATNAGNNEMFQQSNYFKYAFEYFNKEFPKSLPENSIDLSELEATKKAISYTPKPIKKPTLFERLFRRKRDVLPLPEMCYELDKCSLLCEDKEGASVGLLPMMWQMIENNYTSGLNKITFSVEDDNFYLNYCEQDEAYKFNIGFNEPKTNYLSFHSDNQCVKTLAKFTTDEDDRRVLVVDFYFLENPSSRQIKLFFEDDEVVLSQSERPNSKFAFDLINSIKETYGQQPIIGTRIANLEPEYLFFKVNKLFCPTLKLKLVKENEEKPQEQLNLPSTV